MLGQEERTREPLWIGAFETPWGWAGASGLGSVLCRVLLPVRGGKREILRRLSREFPGAVPFGRGSGSTLECIRRLLSGKGKGPSPDLGGFSPFVREALGWMALIPRGTVATYGTLAAWMGKPGAARGVGRAASMNPFPLVVPCHRVVGSDGRLVGFSTDGGTDLKRKLLLWEGVSFLPGRLPRVEKRFFFRGPPEFPRSTPHSNFFGS